MKPASSPTCDELSAPLHVHVVAVWVGGAVQRRQERGRLITCKQTKKRKGLSCGNFAYNGHDMAIAPAIEDQYNQKCFLPTFTLVISSFWFGGMYPGLFANVRNAGLIYGAAEMAFFSS